MLKFNIENIFVAIRYALTALGSGMAGQSFASGSQFQFWAGVVLAGATAAYGQWKTTTAQMAKTTDSLPGIDGVAVSPEIANAIGSKTVTVIESLPAAVADAKS